MGAHAKYCVVELADPREPDLPRAVFACRCDQSPYSVVWDHRNELQGKLAKWFCSLSEAKLRPRVRVFLGRSGVHEKNARAIAKYRIEQISKAAGSFPEYPAFFAMDRPVNVGGRGVPVFADGIMYPSRSAAARAAGVTPRAIYDRLRHGRWGWV